MSRCRTPHRASRSYRSSILSTAQAKTASAFFMSVMTGCIKCGMRLYGLSSTIFGSIISILTCSGVRVIRIERINEFRQTLFPVPVRPAINKCGILAMSMTSGRPETSLPKNNGIRMSSIS